MVVVFFLQSSGGDNAVMTDAFDRTAHVAIKKHWVLHSIYIIEKKICIPYHCSISIELESLQFVPIRERKFSGKK